MVAWRPTPIIPALGDKGSRIKSSRSYIASARLVWLKETSGQKRKSKSIIITKC